MSQGTNVIMVEGTSIDGGANSDIGVGEAQCASSSIIFRNQSLQEEHPNNLIVANLPQSRYPH